MPFRERLRRARTAYLRNPSPRLLRRYLILKARTGVWDERYCRHYNVSPSVNFACKRFIVRGYAKGLVPTSTVRPAGPSSYHSQRDVNGDAMAVDLGLVREEIGTRRGLRRMVSLQRSEHSAFAAGKRPRMIELIGPDNRAIVLRGMQVDLAEGSALETQHDNHVHAAFK